MMKPKTILSGLCVLTLMAILAVVVFANHQPRSEPDAIPGTRTFVVHGQIRGLSVTNQTVRITHEEIPDYMPAMTMPFYVKDGNLLNGLVVGDGVEFDLLVTEDDSWIGRIVKTAPAALVEPGTADDPNVTLQDREDGRVHAGERVPDFDLVDQDGRKIQLSDYRGKAVVLTFIYTRCPLPNFCPLMSKNFVELEQRLSKEFAGQYQLLSISMDPDFDTPEVLKEYAARHDADPEDWTFGTGDADQIAFVARLMGLYYVRENGLISHDLRTALIGPDGRLVHLWKSNVWTPYEVQRMVRETLTESKELAAR